MEHLKLPSDGSSVWAGMGDYLLISPDNTQSITLTYLSEPPHGDSYHYLEVNNKKLPGFAWGDCFAFSNDSRFLVFSWMEKLFERKTIVVDCIEEKYSILPVYINNFDVLWPTIQGNKYQKSYTFSGAETWLSF